MGKLYKNLNRRFFIRLGSTSESSERNPNYTTTLLSAPVRFMSDLTIFQSFLVLQNIIEAANVRQNLDNELIATVQCKLGVAAPANASGRTGDTAWL